MTKNIEINKIVEKLDKLVRVPRELVVLGRFIYLVSLEKSVLEDAKLLPAN